MNSYCFLLHVLEHMHRRLKKTSSSLKRQHQPTRAQIRYLYQALRGLFWTFIVTADMWWQIMLYFLYLRSGRHEAVTWFTSWPKTACYCWGAKTRLKRCFCTSRFTDTSGSCVSGSQGVKLHWPDRELRHILWHDVKKETASGSWLFTDKRRLFLTVTFSVNRCLFGGGGGVSVTQKPLSHTSTSVVTFFDLNDAHISFSSCSSFEGSNLIGWHTSRCVEN